MTDTIRTTPLESTDTLLEIGGRSFRSRLLVGTGKYRDAEGVVIELVHFVGRG